MADAHSDRDLVDIMQSTTLTDEDTAMINTILTQVKNTQGYCYFEDKPTPRKRKKLEVTFITDMVPGAFHDPRDLMEWICHNPYVDTVTLIEDK